MHLRRSLPEILPDMWIPREQSARHYLGAEVVLGVSRLLCGFRRAEVLQHE
jgi:hypothetical protein